MGLLLEDEIDAVDACALRLSLSQTYWLAVDRESGDADL
jgi:hypothetical protein